MYIEEFIDRSNSTNTVKELFDLFEQAVKPFGIDQIVFSLMTDHAALDRQAGHGILANYPEDWMKFYGEQGYESLDPVRHHMFAADGPFAWDDLINSPALTKKQKTFFNQAADAGLQIGFGIPLRGTRGAIAGFGLASNTRQLDLDQNALSRMNLISQQFYQVFLSLERRSDLKPAPRLSEREQEILKWCANGKTRWEIGRILGVSENTVNYHLRSIFSKLDTNNITVAVLHALHSGLIQL